MHRNFIDLIKSDLLVWFLLICEKDFAEIGAARSIYDVHHIDFSSSRLFVRYLLICGYDFAEIDAARSIHDAHNNYIIDFSPSYLWFAVC